MANHSRYVWREGGRSGEESEVSREKRNGERRPERSDEGRKCLARDPGEQEHVNVGSSKIGDPSKTRGMRAPPRLRTISEGVVLRHAEVTSREAMSVFLASFEWCLSNQSVMKELVQAF